MVKRFDPFEEMDKAFEKMDGAFEKMDEILDGVDFQSNIDDVHTKIQKIKDRYNLSTKDAIDAMASHLINRKKHGERIKVRMEVTNDRSRYFIKNLIGVSLLAFFIAIGVLLLTVVYDTKEKTQPPPLVEKSAPVNPTLNVPQGNAESDTPQLRKIE